MDRKYTLLAILVIVLAAGLFLFPSKDRSKEMEPGRLLQAINDPARFLSTDKITERIVGGDPTLQLIDVRPAAQFRIYALPGAINIPLDSILIPSSNEILHQPGKDFVFYSNGGLEADAAWQLCTRAQIKNVFVMQGGLNFWYQTIIKGTEPLSTASGRDIDLYNFRKAAKLYFTGGSMVEESNTVKDNEARKPAKLEVKPKAPKASSGGGC